MLEEEFRLYFKPGTKLTSRENKEQVWKLKQFVGSKAILIREHDLVETEATLDQIINEFT